MRGFSLPRNTGCVLSEQSTVNILLERSTVPCEPSVTCVVVRSTVNSNTMSKKLNADQTGESVVVAVRLPPDLLAGLDRVVAQSARPPFSSPTRSEVARGLIETALRSLGVLEAAAVGNPTPQKAEAPAAAPAPKPTRKPLPPAVASSPARASVGEAVLAALRAAERAGDDLLDVAAVVRAVEAQGYTREETHTELVRLGTAGVDVLELRPDSGGGNERKEDRAIVPQGLDGTPLLEARWVNRPMVAETGAPETDALLVRFLAAVEDRKTSAREAAPAIGCSTTPIGRWKRGEAPLRPKLREKLAAYLDSVGA